MMRKSLFLIFLFILIVSVIAAAQLPPAIQKIIEANRQEASFALENISFLIAFLAGVLSIFSPCTLALLPAFFSYSFKEKTEITKMTLVFFLGFAISFISVGLLIVYLGKTSFAFFQQSTTGVFVQIVGILLVIFGIITVLGKGFSGIVLNIKAKKDIPGVFLFGVMFAIGWTACIGPIIASILLMGSVLHNYLYTAFLLFFYTLGVAVPLFLMAFFYDKYNLAENKWVQGKILNMNFLGFKWGVHTTNLISGAMLMVIGLIFIFYKGSSIINITDIFGMLATLAMLAVIVLLINKYALSKIESSNARKIALLSTIIVALFVFNYLRAKYGLRTLGWAEISDKILLSSTPAYNIIGFIVLTLLVLIVYFGIRQKKEHQKGQNKMRGRK